MRNEYIGEDCIVVTRDVRLLPVESFYIAVYISKGMPSPTMEEMSRCGLQLVKKYDNVNHQAYNVVNQATVKVNEGERVDFENLLELKFGTGEAPVLA